MVHDANTFVCKLNPNHGLVSTQVVRIVDTYINLGKQPFFQREYMAPDVAQ